MTVQEMINELSKYQSDLTVCFASNTVADVSLQQDFYSNFNNDPSINSDNFVQITNQNSNR